MLAFGPSLTTAFLPARDRDDDQDRVRMQLEDFRVFSLISSGRHSGPADSKQSRHRRTVRLQGDVLERRLALATYIWTALGDGQTWNDPQNWLHFDPMAQIQEQGTPTPFSDVIFPAIASLPAGSKANINFDQTFLNIPLNSLTIDDSYTITGNPIAIDRSLSVFNPFTTAPKGSVVTIFLDGLKLSAGATIYTQTGSTLELGSASDPTGLELSLQGGLTKTGGGQLVVDTQTIFYPTTPTLLPVPVSIAGGSITLGASVQLNAVNFQVGSASSLEIADNVIAGIGTLTGTGLVDLEGTTTAGDQTSLTILVPAAVTDQFNGLTDGVGALVKQGGGTLTTGGIDFSGGGSIEAASGTLDVDGPISAGTLQVNDFAELGGLGEWSFTGAAVFEAGSTFNVTLDGTMAGSQYTQLIDTSATSGVNLGFSTLAASIGYDYEQGDQYSLISAPVIANAFGNVVSGRTILSGTVHFAVSTGTTSVTLAPLQSVTTTQLGSSNNPSNPGAPVTLTAVVNTRTSPVTMGTVSFVAGSALLGTVTLSGSGTAILTTTSLPLGTTAIAAVYNGAGGNLSSTSPTLAQSVIPYATKTTLSSDNNPSFVTQPATFTASVLTSVGPVTTGTVTFRRGSQFLGTVSLGGAGTASLSVSSLPRGSARIQAIYNGTPEALSSVSPVLTQSVERLPTTTISSPSTVIKANGAVSYLLVATITAPGQPLAVPAGTVVFKKNGVTIGRSRLKGGTAVLVLGRRVPRGKFIAVFQGGARFRGSTSPPVVFFA
jgi:hypothetical protein